MRVTVADPSLLLLVGPSGSGKSTFARRHFRSTAILSSDDLRGALSDDPNDQSASAEAFQVLTLLLNGRVRRQLLTVVDATNLRAASRRRWLRTATEHGLPGVAICFDLPLDTYIELNRRRPGRRVDESVIRDQAARMATAMAELPDEGYAAIHVLRTPEEVAQSEVVVERGKESPSHGSSVRAADQRGRHRPSR